MRERPLVGFVITNVGLLDHFIEGLNQLLVDVLVSIFENPDDNGMNVAKRKVDVAVFVERI